MASPGHKTTDIIVPTLQCNGFTKNVWFNVRGQWVMTQTDLVSLDRLTPNSL